MPKYSKKAQEKVEEVMHEFKLGKLKSGKSNKVVENPKQAVAIGLSEARKKGAKVPSAKKQRQQKFYVSNCESDHKCHYGCHRIFVGAAFFFEFFGANSSAPFVVWLYGTTAQLVSPFFRIFPSLNLGGFVVDFTTLVAMVIYALIGYLILELFYFVEPRNYRNDREV